MGEMVMLVFLHGNGNDGFGVSGDRLTNDFWIDVEGIGTDIDKHRRERGFRSLRRLEEFSREVESLSWSR